MDTPKPKFEIGEIVSKPAFTDSSGEYQPRIELLRVIECRLENADGEFGLKPYWRIKATPDAHGLAWYEGAERFFEKLGGGMS
jgi:hypothetical protein